MVKEHILCAALVNCALFSPSRAGPITDLALQQLPVTELKAIYLGCERSAMRGLIGPGEAGSCSIAFEELKRRAFDGDFETFLKWWRTQIHVNIPAP
jgi:hypothetical protein